MEKFTFIQKRLNFFSRVMGIILMILSIAIVVTQTVKILPLLEEYPGWTWTWGNITALIIGIILFLLGKKQTIKKLVHYSCFSGREKMKRLIFSLPISLMLLIMTMKVILGHDSREYIMMNTEGGLIEYGTSLAYILAFVFSIPIANYFLNQKRKWWGILYYLFAFGLLFIALEEISWGQRFLGWQTPDFFLTHNSQKDTTIHNLEWFRHYLHNIYILIGFVGSFGWLIIGKNSLIRYFIPSWFVSIYFLPSLVIFTILEYTDGFGFFILKDQESVELVLSLGFLFLVLTNFFRQSLECDDGGIYEYSNDNRHFGI